jgi:glycosyltransferase involved in cell wall biosynthesis
MRSERAHGSSRDRFVVVGPTPPPAHGVSVMTQHLLDALAAEGLLARHVDTKDPRPIETVGRLDLRNIWLGIAHGVSFQRALVAEPRAGVYVPISQGVWGFLRDAVFLLSARLMRRRRIVHLHGGYFGSFYREAGKPLRLLIRAALRGSDQAWVLTDGLRRELHGLVDPARIHVLENAVEDPQGLPPRRLRTASELRVLYLANLIPEKGCFDLIEALERLGSDGRGMMVRFVGDASGEVEEELNRRGRALSGGATVEFLGPMSGPQRDEQYAWADLFAFPTKYRFEGQPLVVLEALAAGLPILTTSHRGIPETVRGEHEAVLVPPGDSRRLAAALVRLRDDPDLRARLSLSARRRYEERYTIPRFRADVVRLAQLTT